MGTIDLNIGEEFKRLFLKSYPISHESLGSILSMKEWTGLLISWHLLNLLKLCNFRSIFNLMILYFSDTILIGIMDCFHKHGKTHHLLTLKLMEHSAIMIQVIMKLFYFFYTSCYCLPKRLQDCNASWIYFDNVFNL